MFKIHLMHFTTDGTVTNSGLLLCYKSVKCCSAILNYDIEYKSQVYKGVNYSECSCMVSLKWRASLERYSNFKPIDTTEIKRESPQGSPPGFPSLL